MAVSETKREYVRISDEFNVRLVKKGEPSERNTIEINSSKSINVSGSGLLLSTDRKLDVGDTVSITFMKPNTFDFFKGSGRIVRVEEDGERSYRIGISFVDLSAEDKKILDYYINLGKK
ncbi:MAG: PilZ domain-containing protein [Spirochaetes bacterium]|nr:PilZ domain-containing protein [Spirochaetota bacterium]